MGAAAGGRRGSIPPGGRGVVPALVLATLLAGCSDGAREVARLSWDFEGQTCTTMNGHRECHPSVKDGHETLSGGRCDGTGTLVWDMARHDAGTVRITVKDASGSQMHSVRLAAVVGDERVLHGKGGSWTLDGVAEGFNGKVVARLEC